MRVLVTGGAGFVGSHVVDALVARGDDVVVVDRVEPPAAVANRGARYVCGDVRDEAVWEEATAGVDAVCHQAARVGLGVDFADVGGYVADNDGGTAAGLAALHARGFTGPLVLASSMVVYGEGRYRCAEHGVVRPAPRAPERLDAGAFEPPCPRCGRDLGTEPVTEDAPADPRNVYAATKLHQEHLVAAYVREHPGATAVALRYHNVYGPRMPRDTPYAGVASLFRSALARGEPPLVFEDGLQTRDFVHVTDVARANALALGSAPGGFTAFNVCSGRPRTVGDLAAALWASLGSRPDCRPVVTGRWRAGDVRHVFASPDRAAA
ncbi:MAG: NAD-dependent epimerase/dehydratase family protein, partial [Actinomycetota bacterium]|nr:NAD-dependent epimerase/dehydratase family protein [Actinomycetota bacterium]